MTEPLHKYDVVVHRIEGDSIEIVEAYTTQDAWMRKERELGVFDIDADIMSVRLHADSQKP